MLSAMRAVEKLLANACTSTGSFSAGLLCNGLSGAAMEAIKAGGLGAGLVALGLSGPTLIPAAIVLTVLGGTAVFKAICDARKERELEGRFKAIETTNRTIVDVVQAMREAIDATGVRLHADEVIDLRSIVAAANATDLTRLTEATAKQIIAALDNAGLATAEQLMAIEGTVKETWLRTLHIWEEQRAGAAWLREWEIRLNAKLDAIAADAKAAADDSKIAAAAAVDNRDLLKAHGFTPLIAPNLPPLPESYVERPGPMTALEAALAQDGRANLRGRAQASSGGGYGKSVMAFAYAHRKFARYTGGVYVASCEGRSVVEALTSLMPDHEGVRTLPAEVKASIVRAKLSSGGPALLILDNIDTVVQWHQFRDSKLLPSLPCAVLITTRAEDIKDVVCVAIEQLEEREAVELLGNFRASAKLPANTDAIGTILRETERIAALVAAVGMAMAEEYSDDWASYAAWLVTAQPDDLPDAGDWIKNYRDYPHKTAAILDDLRRRLHPAALRALDYAALLPADMIPRGWLEWLLDADFQPDAGERRLTPETSTTGTPRNGTWYVDRLKERGLLRRFGADDTLWSMHRLHRKRAMDHFAAQPEREAAAWLAIAACAMARRGVIVGRDAAGADRSIDNPVTLTNATLRWELKPLAAVCIALWARAGSARDAGDETMRPSFAGTAAQLGVWVADVLKLLGRLVEASACILPVAGHDSVVEQVVGAKALGGCYNSLSLIQKELNELPAAESSILKAINAIERTSPIGLQSYAAAHSNLAMIRLDRKNFTGARESMGFSIWISQQSRNPDPLGLARGLSNLATIVLAEGRAYASKGEVGKARDTYAVAQSHTEAAIDNIERHLGPDHPHLATSLSNLAAVQKAQGDLFISQGARCKAKAAFAAARASMRRCITINESVLDERHHIRARDYNNLAHVELADDRVREAVALWRKSYAIRLKALGPDHPYTKDDAEMLRKYDPPGP